MRLLLMSIQFCIFELVKLDSFVIGSSGIEVVLFLF